MGRLSVHDRWLVLAGFTFGRTIGWLPEPWGPVVGIVIVLGLLLGIQPPPNPGGLSVIVPVMASDRVATCPPWRREVGPWSLTDRRARAFASLDPLLRDPGPRLGPSSPDRAAR